MLENTNQSIALCQKGRELSKAERYEEADALFGEAIRLDPGRIDLRLAYAASLTTRRRHAEAADVLATASAMAPRNPDLFYALGRSLAAAGRAEEAMSAYHRTVTLEPGRSGAHRALATLLRGQGNFYEAIAAQKRALALDPGNFEGPYELGRTLAAIGRSAEAAAMLRRATELHRRHALARFFLGRQLLNINDRAGAATALSEAVALCPANKADLLWLGRVLATLGQHGEAAQAYQRVLRIDASCRESATALAASTQAVQRLDRKNKPDRSYLLDSTISLSICFLRPLTEDDHIALVRLQGCFDEIIVPAAERFRSDDLAASLRVVEDDWRLCLAASTSEWTLPVVGPCPDPPTVKALCRRVGAGVGLISTSVTLRRTDPQLYRTVLLKTLLAVADPVGPWEAFADEVIPRLRHRAFRAIRELKPASKSHGPPEAWIILENDSLTETSLVSAYRSLGYRPILIAWEDAPWTKEAGPSDDRQASIRHSVVRHRPALLHCSANLSAIFNEALEGLTVPVVTGLTRADAAVEAFAPGRLAGVVNYAVSHEVRDAIEERSGVTLPILPLARGEATDDRKKHDAADRTIHPRRLGQLAALGTLRVACVVGGGIGNMIQCSPAIRRLAEHLERPVDVILNQDFPGCDGLFADAPWVGTVFRTAAHAAAICYDLVLVLDPFFGPKPDLNAGQILPICEDFSFYMTQRMHEAEYYLNAMWLLLNMPYDRSSISKYFIGGYERGSAVPRRIGLHAGCKPGVWEAKKWPFYPALAQRLRSLGFEVLSLGGAGESIPGTVDATGRRLRETIETIRSCSYFISNDSGLMHIADALGVPLTVIFAPSSVIKNGPRAPTSQVVQLDKSCAPCQFNASRLATCRCIAEISIEEVWSRVSRHMPRSVTEDLGPDDTEPASSAPSNRRAHEAPRASVVEHPAEVAASGRAMDVEARSDGRKTSRFDAAARQLMRLPVRRRLELAGLNKPPSPRVLVDLDCGFYSGSCTTRLVEVGALDDAWGGIRRVLATPGGLLDLGSQEFKLLLDSTWVLGLQGDVVAAIQDDAAAIFGLYPEHAASIGECAAVVLSPNDLGALLCIAVKAVLCGPRPHRVAALIILACDCCSYETIEAVLLRVDASERADVLSKDFILQKIGDALSSIASSPLSLPRTGLTTADFQTFISPDKRVLRALGAADRAAFIEGVNAVLEQSGGAEKLGKALRSFTDRIAQFAIAPGEVRYSSADPPEDMAHLAVILNDQHGLAPGAPSVLPSAHIVWRSRQNDYRPLIAALSTWLTAVGAVPIEIAGTTRAEVFRSCVLDRALPPAEDRGKVSVILCVYNPDVELLRLAIASIWTQTYKNLELIIVDDASDPVHAEAIATLATSGGPVRLLRNAVNAGPYHGRNRALEVATGEFIAFHDADDVAHPQRLAVQIGALLASDGYVLCFAKHLRFDGRGGLQFEIDADALSIRGDGPITAVFRRRALDVVGPFVSVRTRGDVEMRARIEACYGRHAVRYLGAPLMYCAGEPNSLSNAMRTQHKEYIRLFYRSFSQRAWPLIVDQVFVSPPVGDLAVPFVLRSNP